VPEHHPGQNKDRSYPALGFGFDLRGVDTAPGTHQSAIPWDPARYFPERLGRSGLAYRPQGPWLLSSVHLSKSIEHCIYSNFTTDKTLRQDQNEDFAKIFEL